MAVDNPPRPAAPRTAPREVEAGLEALAPGRRWSAEIEARVGAVAAGTLTIASAAAYSAIALYRFDHFGANGFDLGIQDQTVWGYSRLEIVQNTVLGIPNLLGDHFNPILMVLAPFRAVWDSAAVLLVAQAILLAVAGIPIYMWGAQRLGRVAGLAFQASYLVFWGVLAGVVFDFHHVVFAVPAISTALYATLNRHNRLLWAAVAVAMLTREDLALTVVALGLYIAVVQRRKLLGAALLVLNGAWLVVLVDAVMPALGGSPYQHWTYPALGTGPVSASVFLLEHPLKGLQLLVTPIEKLRVGFGTFANWLFLPLISPIVIVAVPSFLERFWSSSSDLWSFHFQYSMLPAPILTFAAIDGLARVTRLPLGRAARTIAVAVPLAALVASSLLSAVVVRPLAELSGFVSDATAAEIQQCIDVIPGGVSVAATDALVPHLTSREKIYEVTTHADADYIAIDLNTLGRAHPADAQLRGIVQTALGAGYGVACSRGYTVVLGRGVPSGQLSPELERWLASDCSGAACLSKP
jgi:uncharacterized membrane protein